MIRFDNIPPEIMQAMCTPMHKVALPGPPQQQLGSLWVGSFAAGADADLLRQHGIAHLVQVLDAPWLPSVSDRSITITRITILDTPNADLTSHLEDACRRIDKSLKSGKNVLVHCQQGVSRSAAVAIAYLIKYYGMTYDSAFAYVRTCRPCIKPNSGFIRSLRDWEIKCSSHQSSSSRRH